jgi:malate dehydrogenase (oxaloacetate-decarboxylating)(NADP+)
VQAVLDEGLARPVLIGRPEVISERIRRAGLRLVVGQDMEVVNPDADPRYKELWKDYYQIMSREGVTMDMAKKALRSDSTLIGSLLLRRGYVDAMLCGLVGRHDRHLRHVRRDRLTPHRADLRHHEPAAATPYLVRLRYLRPKTFRRTGG